MDTKSIVLGLKVRALNAKQHQTLGLGKGGLRVLEVLSGPAKDAGVRKGDVLKMINNEKILTVEQFKTIIEGLPKNEFVSILVQRREQPKFLALKVPG
jgi:serine protease Do